MDTAYSGSTVKWNVGQIVMSTDSDQGNILLLLAETHSSASLWLGNGVHTTGTGWSSHFCQTPINLEQTNRSPAVVINLPSASIEVMDGAAPTDKRSENGPPTLAEVGKDYCNRLFKIEETLSGVTSDERYLKRLELEKPLLVPFGVGLIP